MIKIKRTENEVIATYFDDTTGNEVEYSAQYYSKKIYAIEACKRMRKEIKDGAGFVKIENILQGLE